VASEDNTLVTISPAKDIIGHAASAPFNITLNKGQTYAAIAASQAASQHLQGSHIISSKPIAITISDDLLYGDKYAGMCADLAGDQTVPISVTGDEYIAIKSNLNSPFDKVYITATQNSTSVVQDGITITTLNAGESKELTVSNAATYIQTSAPAYAYQLSGDGCEVGAAILPKITCTGSSSVSLVRSTDEMFVITLLVKNGGQNGFLINDVSGIITASQFNPASSATGLWYYAKITLPLSTYPNGSIIKVSNSLDIFQCGVLQGGIFSGVSFGYFSDFNSLRATASSNNFSPCEGTVLQFSAESIASATYNWTGPNFFTSNSQNPSIYNLLPANSGKYLLNVTAPNCVLQADSIIINVLPKSFSTISSIICNGKSYLGHNSTGIYIDTLVAVNGCDSIRKLDLTVKPATVSTISSIICNGQSYLGHNSTGVYIDTLIAVNGCDSIRKLDLTVKPAMGSSINQIICFGQSYMGHNSAGTYIDTLLATNGCDSIRILNLEVTPKLFSILDTSICTGQAYEGHINAGTFEDTLVDANGCESIRRINLSVEDKPNPNLGLDTNICISGELLISPGVFNNYLWQDGSTRSSFLVKGSGLYSVTVSNSCGSSTDEIMVTEKPCEIYFPNAFTPNNDGKNDVFNILNASDFQSYYLAIYNRWGEKVFETKNAKKGWDGNKNSQQAEMGVYVWYCKFKKSNVDKIMKGTVTLVR
jgi:gliding motility-associated-like protein